MSSSAIRKLELHVVRSAIELAQLEDVFGSVRRIHEQLEIAVEVVDHDQDLRAQLGKLRIKQKDHVFTKGGQQALDRMTFEALATMAEWATSDAEVADEALDHRTMLCPMHTAAEAKDCVDELRLACIKFGVVVTEHDAAVTTTCKLSRRSSQDCKATRMTLFDAPMLRCQFVSIQMCGRRKGHATRLCAPWRAVASSCVASLIHLSSPQPVKLRPHQWDCTSARKCEADH